MADKINVNGRKLDAEDFTMARDTLETLVCKHGIRATYNLIALRVQTHSGNQRTLYEHMFRKIKPVAERHGLVN